MPSKQKVALKMKQPSKFGHSHVRSSSIAVNKHQQINKNPSDDVFDYKDSHELSSYPYYVADDFDSDAQIFVSVYAGDTCRVQDLADGNLFQNNECSSSLPQVYYNDDLSIEVECAALSTSSSWTVNVYEDTTCSGTALISLQGSGPCSCKTLAYQGGSLSVKVNCDGTRVYPCQSYQDDAYYSDYYDSSYSRSALYGKIYESSSCSSSAASTGHYFANNQCLYSSSLGFKVTCEEPTSTGSWSAMVYPTSNCSSSSVASLGTISGDGACECASGTFADVEYSLQINCAGTKSFTCGSSSSENTYSTSQVTGITVGAVTGLGLIAVLVYWLLVLRPRWIAAEISTNDTQNQVQNRETEISVTRSPIRATRVVEDENKNIVV